MNIYTLWYTNECGYDQEKEFEAQGPNQAIELATNMCRGNEGLWSGVSLTDSIGNELEFNPF